MAVGQFWFIVRKQREKTYVHPKGHIREYGCNVYMSEKTEMTIKRKDDSDGQGAFAITVTQMIKDNSFEKGNTERGVHSK